MNRWGFWITSSFGMPSVSGRRNIISGSPFETAAAAWMTRPPEAPLVTVAASAPMSDAISLPAAISSSSMLTKASDMACIASIADWRGLLPECLVLGPPALMIGVTSRRFRISAPVMPVEVVFARGFSVAVNAACSGLGGLKFSEILRR